MSEINDLIQNPKFVEAKPVWPIAIGQEWNRMVGFYLPVEGEGRGKKSSLKITGADTYRIWVNGKYVGCGPARGPHGYSRVDEWDLALVLDADRNHLAIEVLTHGVDSYAYVMQSPFLQAEYLENGKVVASTGRNFSAFHLVERIQKVERFSKQRPFAEAYRLSKDSHLWRLGRGEMESLECEEKPSIPLLKRYVPYPNFECLFPEKILARGSVEKTNPPRPPIKHAARNAIGKRVRGYPVEELEIDMSEEINAMSFIEESLDVTSGNVKVPPRNHILYDFGIIQGGFVGSRLKCRESTRVYLMFEEVKERNLFVLGVGAIYLELEPGTHHFESIDPYTFRYLRLVSLDSEVEVENVYVRDYANPVKKISQHEEMDDELALICDAAYQTFRTNAIDLFTDCMSRERGGYPCDSWFTGRAEKVFTDSNIVERNFLENYFMVEKFSSIPKGMFPHCYPSDRLGEGQYIPNWALWLVLELCRYCEHHNDSSLKQLAFPRVEALFEWFEPCLNELGLLEDIPGWIFVEWSPANDCTDAVNHPTNMLYAACLEASGKIYERKDWMDRADAVRQAVLRESWDGEFFHDQSIRVDGKLTRGRVRTETCQYHAFSFGVAQGEKFEGLWAKLRDHWGPKRGMHMAMDPDANGWKLYYDEGSGPRSDDDDLAPAGLLFGLMLRFDILQERQEWDLLLEEIRNIFGPMAKQSGTLWEHVEPHASLNHGFASCAIEYIQNALKAKSAGSK